MLRSHVIAPGVVRPLWVVFTNASPALIILVAIYMGRAWIRTEMIDKARYNRRIIRTFHASVYAALLLVGSLLVLDISVTPSHLLALSIVMAIIAFIYNYRPRSDLAFQIQASKSSSQDEFERYFKLAVGGLFLLAFFGTALLLAAPEMHSPKEKLISLIFPPFLTAVAPRFIAIFRLLARSYRKI